MKIKEGFVTRKVVDTIVAVPTGDLLEEFQGIINLNHSSKFAWDLLQKDTTVEEVASKLSKEYEIDIHKARADVEKFIKNLKKLNLIEE